MRARSLAWVAFTLLSAGAPASAATIDYTDALGNEWRALTDTLGFSWNEVDAICANDGATACSGSIGAVELSGWIWATQDQVYDLYREITGLTTELDDYTHEELNSAWAPAALALFTPTNDALTAPFIHGWTATEALVGPSKFSSFLSDQCCQNAKDFIETVLQSPTHSHHTIGVWQFRPAVPEPSASLLFGAGFGIVALRLRKRGPAR